MQRRFLGVLLLTACLPTVDLGEGLDEGNQTGDAEQGSAWRYSTIDGGQLRFPTASALGDGVVVVEAMHFWPEDGAITLRHFTPQGEETWSLALPWFPASVVAMPDGGYLLGGPYVEDGPTVIPVSADGVMSPAIHFEGHTSDRLLALAAASDGVYVVLARGAGAPVFLRTDLAFEVQTEAIDDTISDFPFQEFLPWPVAVAPSGALVFREGSHATDDALMHVLTPDGSFLEPSHGPAFDLIAGPDQSLTVLHDDESADAHMQMRPFAGADLVDIEPFAHLRYINEGDMKEFYAAEGINFAFVFAATEEPAPHSSPRMGIVAEVAADGELLREVTLLPTLPGTDNAPNPWILPHAVAAGPDGTIYVVVDEDSFDAGSTSTLHAVAPAP